MASSLASAKKLPACERLPGHSTYSAVAPGLPSNGPGQALLSGRMGPQLGGVTIFCQNRQGRANDISGGRFIWRWEIKIWRRGDSTALRDARSGAVAGR